MTRGVATGTNSPDQEPSSRQQCPVPVNPQRLGKTFVFSGSENAQVFLFVNNLDKGMS
jgi:hypothetical protein